MVAFCTLMFLAQNIFDMTLTNFKEVTVTYTLFNST